MKRYISISLSLLIVSVVNIVTWICLGFTMGNPNLTSVFSLTYAVWFIEGILFCVFATGANVRKNKRQEKTNNIVYSGMIWAMFFGIIIFGILTAFSDNYVKFMHMDVAVYGRFARFTMLQALAWLLVQLVTEKLYFDKKDFKANLFGILFYVLNFVSLILCSLITKNEYIITGITLGILYIYAIVLFATSFKKFKFVWNFLPNIKYDSVSLCSNVLFFITYFVGYSNAFEYGAKYVAAINLVNIVTDPQWDALTAIGKIAKIDLSKNEYNFKSAIKNSSILTLIYATSSVTLFFALFKTYGAPVGIGLIYLAMQLIDMVTDIFSQNLRCFLQLSFSSMLTTILNMSIMGLRTLLSIFLITPFNTGLSQGTTGALECLIYIIITVRLFKLTKVGVFVPKKKKIKVDNIVLYVDRVFRV